MNKPQIIGIGLNGLVGSRVSDLLSDDFQFMNFNRNTGLDITNKHTFAKLRELDDAKFILLMAGKTDVDSCEEDKDLVENGDAWKINVEGVGNIAEFAKETNKKIIYISTDFVFDGAKNEGDSYSEDEDVGPVNWYGKTKSEGEKRVQESGADYLIVRIAYPYRAKYDDKLDFVRFIKSRLGDGQEIRMVTDHIFCPVFIDDVALGLKKLILGNEEGVYHLVGKDKLTPYEAALKIAEVFDLNKDLIKKTTREEFFKNRAPRPFNLALSDAKIEKLGVEIKGFDKSLQEIKSDIQ